MSAQHISLRCLQEPSRSRQNAFKCGYISCMMHYAEKYYADLEKCTRNLAETTNGVPTSFSENPSEFFVKNLVKLKRSVFLRAKVNKFFDVFCRS